jgi:hypothetical protein
MSHANNQSMYDTSNDNRAVPQPGFLSGRGLLGVRFPRANTHITSKLTSHRSEAEDKVAELIGEIEEVRVGVVARAVDLASSPGYGG